MKLIEKLVVNVFARYDNHLVENNIRDESKGLGFKNWCIKEYHLDENEYDEMIVVFNEFMNRMKKETP